MHPSILFCLMALTTQASATSSPATPRTDPRPSKGGSLFGRAVLALPDLNGDGLQEVAVGAPGQELLGRTGAGLVFILDGASAEVINYWLPNQHYGIGDRLERAPDLDGDGLDDVLVGFERLPISEVRSSATGKVLATLPLSPGVLHTIDDVDGDGIADFLSPQRKSWSVFSSKLDRDPDGEELGPLQVLQVTEPPAKGTFDSLEREVEHGGFDGVVVGSDITFLRTVSQGRPRYQIEPATWQTEIEGRITRVAPLTNGLLVSTTTKSDERFAYFIDRAGAALTPRFRLDVPFPDALKRRRVSGYELLAPGDLNADGRDDLLVATPDRSDAAGAAAFSSADGSLLWKTSWNDSTKDRILDLEALSDIDGDGVVDVLVGTSDHSWYSFHAQRGNVRVLSGATGKELWSVEETQPTLTDPFELATLNRRSVVIVAGKDSRRAEQVALLRGDHGSALERDALVLVLDGDEVEVAMGELSFELPARYVRERFEVSRLDFEVTTVGLDGKAKGYFYGVTTPTELWASID